MVRERVIRRAPATHACAAAGRFPLSGPSMKNRGDQLEIDTQLASLRAAHRALDYRIEQLQADGFLDQVALQRLKRQKLILKDRITQLEHDRLPDIIA